MESTKGVGKDGAVGEIVLLDIFERNLDGEGFSRADGSMG